MQAITTKYIAPTNTKGSRIAARCQARRIVVDWNDDLDQAENHAVAAKRLAMSLEWIGEWVGGGLPDDSGFAFVCTDVEKSWSANFKLRRSNVKCDHCNGHGRVTLGSKAVCEICEGEGFRTTLL